jgi:hypothetical protein
MKLKTCNTIKSALTTTLLGLAMLLPRASSAVTIVDTFTNAANWGPPFLSPGKNMGIGGGRMNYTAATADGGGGYISRVAQDLRGTNVLLVTQDWSLQVDAHLYPFDLTTLDQFSDVFLGFGKTGDLFNTHVMYEFARGLFGGSHYGYNLQDNVRTNGVSLPWEAKLFSFWDLPSGDVSLRIDYSAASQSITYYFDADGATGGYNWVAEGTANLATGTCNLHLAPGDTLTILLAGSSEFQTVAYGQAYLTNLVITLPQRPLVTTGAATNITHQSASLNGVVNPNGLTTTAQFEYGLTTNYGTTANVTLSPDNGVTSQAVSTTLSGLQSGATYHYRLAAANSDGSGIGDDATFKTGIPGNYNYLITTNTYSPYTDWSLAVKQEFGLYAEVVDWNILKSDFGGSVEAIRGLFDYLGILAYPAGDAPAVTWNGSQTWDGSRSFGVNRLEGTVPGGYLVHDEIQNYWVCLGSWPADRRIIARVALLPPPYLIPTGSSFGLSSNGTFGFSVTGAAGQKVVVEGSTNLLNWVPLRTNTLGSSPLYYSDSDSTNHPSRFYRVRTL